MITPAHRAAIEDQVKGANKRVFPEIWIDGIIKAWMCNGYPRAEVEAIVYKEEEQNDHTDAHSKPA